MVTDFKGLIRIHPRAAAPRALWGSAVPLAPSPVDRPHRGELRRVAGGIGGRCTDHFPRGRRGGQLDLKHGIALCIGGDLHGAQVTLALAEAGRIGVGAGVEFEREGGVRCAIRGAKRTES